METVSAGLLAEEVGVSHRTIQFWTDAGVLHVDPSSDRQGRGKPRAYPASERMFVRVAHEMAKLRIPVGTMRQVNDLLRCHPWIVQRALTGEHYEVLLFSVGEGDELGMNVLKFDGPPVIGARFNAADLNISGGGLEDVYERATATVSGEFLTARSGFQLNLRNVLSDMRAA